MAGPDSTAGEVKHLSVRTGQPFQIHLWEDRTRGEQWVPSYEVASMALVNDDYLRLPATMPWTTGRARSSFVRSSRASIGSCLKSAWAGNSPPKIAGCFSSTRRTAQGVVRET